MSPEIAPVLPLPEDGEAVGHAHHLDNLGVAPARFGQRHPAVGEPGRFARRATTQEFGHQGKGDEDHTASRRRNADPGMEEEADDEVERHPRQVEQRRGAHRRQERADSVEVVQRLVARRRHGA